MSSGDNYYDASNLIPFTVQLTDDAESITTPTEWAVFLVALVAAVYLGVMGPWRVGGSTFGLPYLVAAATFFSSLMLVIGIALEWSVRYSNVDLYRE